MTEQDVVSAIGEAMGGLGLSSAAGKEAVLFAKGGKLDSLGLVSLIVETEQILAQKFGRHLVLADPRAFALENGPFGSVGSFADFIMQKIQEDNIH